MQPKRVVVCTDPGRVRPNNEDYASYYVPPDPEMRTRLGSLFIIADGIGGRNAGEVASTEAVSALQQEYYFGRGAPEPGRRLEQATARANFHVFNMSMAMASAKNMGCAMTALLICRGRYYISHVGDTRCYLIRGGQIKKLTSDHVTSAAAARFGMGLFGSRSPAGPRSLLTRSIGVEMMVRPEITDGALYGGDRLLLVTDGITKYMERDELLVWLLKGTDLDETGRLLIAECNRRGGEDNLTLMLLALEG